MRILASVFAVMGLLAAACTMPDLSRHTPSPVPQVALADCPDGLPEQPGLTGFGAYIGTWQANHSRIPDTTDYTFATGSGRVGVQCSSSNHVIAESITLTFHVPSGRAVQFALSDLPSDSRKVFDHTYDACRSLQYRSPTLSAQLPHDDRVGLVHISIASLVVNLRVGTTLGDDSHPCPGL